MLIGDPRVEDWETVSTFEQQATAVAWRDHAAARPAQPLGCSSADSKLRRELPQPPEKAGAKQLATRTTARRTLRPRGDVRRLTPAGTRAALSRFSAAQRPISRRWRRCSDHDREARDHQEHADRRAVQRRSKPVNGRVLALGVSAVGATLGVAGATSLVGALSFDGEASAARLRRRRGLAVAVFFACAGRRERGRGHRERYRQQQRRRKRHAPAQDEGHDIVSAKPSRNLSAANPRPSVGTPRDRAVRSHHPLPCDPTTVSGSRIRFGGKRRRSPMAIVWAVLVETLAPRSLL